MMTIRLRLVAFGAALAGAALLAGCSTTVPPTDPVYTSIARLQRQVNQLQSVVKGQGLMDMASSQQQISQQLSDLQGQIQDLQHQVGQMQQRQQATDQNLDRRVTVLEGGGPTGFAGATPGAQNGVGVAGNPPNPAGSSAIVPNPGANPAGGGAAAGQTSDYAAYQAAFAKLRGGDNAAAITAFQQFVQNYPNSRFVPNALYWLAETHYVNGQYQGAIADFRQVLAKYPDSPKAADSLLKIGYAQYALKDYKGANATFKSVIQKYPGTTPADLATQRLQKMGAQGGG